MSETPLRARSLFFVPGGRPDMIAKLPRFAPDIAVLDLEDAVAADQKETAREVALAALDALEPMPQTTVLVRVNPVGTPWFEPDVAAVAGSAAAGVVLAKVESRDQVEAVHHALRPGAVVVAGLETAVGVADARQLLNGVTACYFGAEDYIADMGGRRTAAGLEVAYARSQVVLAARLTGAVPIDQAVVGFDDDARFMADAREGADLGYHGKICIHPRQVSLAHEAFTPTEDEVAHAHAVLEAGASGVGVLDGQMIDDVHVRTARAILKRAGSA